MLSWPAPARAYGFLLFALCELGVPLWAERAGKTSWHPHHIAERYGLLTLIVLGESVLSATEAVQSALEASASSWQLLSLGAGGLLIVFSIWWIYFEHPAQRVLHSTRVAFVWGYGHFPIFASIAATGAGSRGRPRSRLASGHGRSGGDPRGDLSDVRVVRARAPAHARPSAGAGIFVHDLRRLGHAGLIGRRARDRRIARRARYVSDSQVQEPKPPS
jgi:hypothetical protein